MKKLFLLTLILSFFFASSAMAGQVTATITNKCFPANGTLTVPSGKTAIGFKVVGLNNGMKCRGGGKPDCKGWGIKSSNNARMYNWSQCKTNRPYESRPLSTLMLGPGTYFVYVDGGIGANVTVAYTIK